MKKLGRKQLIKKADKQYSLYVRQKYANESGIVKCFTCEYSAHWKRMQNGHYITRSIKYLRWELDNCRPQCFVCNMRNQGMSHLFRERLVIELGEPRVAEMELIAKKKFNEEDEYIVQKTEEISHNLDSDGLLLTIPNVGYTMSV